MELLLTDGNRAKPLPEWARWFVALGEEVRASQDERERLTVAVSVPRREYASLLIALGIVKASLVAELVVPDDPAVRLDELEPGSPITLIDTHQKIRFARIMEMNRDHSGRLISIKYDRNGHRGVPDPIERKIEFCTGVDSCASDDLEFQLGRSVGRDPEFAAQFVGEENFERFACHNRMSCLIVGEVKSLLEESMEVQFAAKSDQVQQGSLFDLLRPRFGDQDQPLHRSLPARSQVVRSNGEDLISPERFVEGACTVFDGGSGYLRNRDLAIGNSVVVINRWATHASSTVATFMQDRAMSMRDAELRVMKSRPTGVEVIGYWSRA